MSMIQGVRARLLLVAALLLAPAAGCGVFSGDPDPADTAAAFVQAVAGGNAPAAGRLTDSPRPATELISQVRDALAPRSVRITLEQTREGEDTATASYTATWDLGNGRRWRYPGTFDMARTDTEQGWSVRWSSSVLHPQLAAQQRVALREDEPDAAPVLDRAGTPLLQAERVVSIVLDREATEDLPGVASALSGPLVQFDPAITPDSIIAGANATPVGQPYVVAVLRDDDYLLVRDQIYELPGVTFPDQQRLLGPDRDFASQLLPGIRTEVAEQLAGAAGWRVVTVDAVGTEVETLVEEPAEPAPAVTTTIDRTVQAAGEDAIEGVPQAAMIVAMAPSTGEVLAVAQNAAADAQGALALTGRYPPGSTFKIATAAAALDAGTVQLESPVQCPATTTIETRLVPNIDLFELGTVPFRLAFARSCNTTFSQLAADFEPDQLTAAAYRLGIGQDFDVAGMTTLTGEVPPSDSVVQRAENGFGQGQVLTTPFGMALLTATVAAGGTVPTPTLLRGTDTEVLTEPAEPLPAAVADDLRVMMRDVVTLGSGEGLAGFGALHGKTGTAEYSSTGSHGWFVGFRGDLAFATLVVDAGSSGPAVDASGRFLAGVGPG